MMSYYRKFLLKISVITLIFSFVFITISCASNKSEDSKPISDITEEIEKTETSSSLPAQENQQIEAAQNIVSDKNHLESDQINILFGGDIMAHSNNYNITSYDKIWKDVKDVISSADLAMANIEAPIDQTKKYSSYPNFNTTKNYVQASIDAGFDIFSLCNNHTNDQGLEGILETMKSTEELTKSALEKNEKIYFSGLHQNNEEFSYNLIEKKGWKILFLPITELLNRPNYTSYINFVSPDAESRVKFAAYVKQLRETNPCDLFVLSVHTCEPEYTREITEKQNNFYMSLLDSGVDVIMANHAHIIKDRKFIFDAENQTQKLIMYANGNVISGQRTKPDFSSQNPNGERDNTGDGLLYSVTFTKENGKIKITNAKPIFITTYINTANEYVIKKLDQDFVVYLEEIPRKNWADYIKRRIKINEKETKDLILWR